MLLGQAHRMLRRCEQVSFSASGSTRRSITFDVVLPAEEKPWLTWRRPSSSEEQISNAAEYEDQEDILRAYLPLSPACDAYPFVMLIPREQAHGRLLIKTCPYVPYRERLINIINPCEQTIGSAFRTNGTPPSHRVSQTGADACEESRMTGGERGRS